MTVAILVAIALAIALGYKTKINTGLFGIVFAYIIGCFFMGIRPSALISMWPVRIFFIVMSISLFYNFAIVNGTLEKLAMRLLYACRKFPNLLPLFIYFAATIVAALGAGYFTVLAIFAPITLLICRKTGMSLILGSVAVNYGALAGANFMTSASGMIFRGLVEQTEYAPDAFAHTTSIFLTTFILPIVVLSVWIFISGKKGTAINAYEIDEPEEFNDKQKKTLGLIFALVFIVLIFPVLTMIFPGNDTIKYLNGKIDIGLMAIIFAVIALLLKLGDQREVMAKVPWNTLIMICGVGMLIQVAIEAGTIDMLASWVGTSIPAWLIPFALTIIAGIMSFFSSTLGVVTPALFPTVPAIAAAANLNPMLLFTVIVAGSQATSISPFSSGGSLMLGSCDNEEERAALFPKLMFRAVPMCLAFALIACLVLDFIL
ncbi:MAG: SLC13 family permease [Christensenellaceae bacterium]|jgi:di/tricarboxylate transporter|nr:SLC13 family permease [Christensenellaceae bacterium]